MSSNPKFSLRNWIVLQYRVMEGNLKTWLLFTILGGIMTGFAFLVGGLPLWRHISILALFFGVCIWASVATWKASGHQNRLGDPFSPEQEAVLSPLQIEVFQLAKDLQEFIDSVGPIPADRPFGFTSNGFIDGLRDSMHRFGAWSTQLNSGYTNKFSKKVKYLRHQLATRGVNPWPEIPDEARAINYRDILKLPQVIAQSAVELQYPNPPTNPSEWSLLSPLQNDAIRLSTELLKFLDALGPEPTPKYTEYEIQAMPESKRRELIKSKDKDYIESSEYHLGEVNALTSGGPFQTADQLHVSLMAGYRLLNPWYESVTASYELQFKEKIGRLRNQFIVEKIADDDVLLVPVQGKKGPEVVRTMAAKLWELAYKVGEKNGTQTT